MSNLHLRQVSPDGALWVATMPASKMGFEFGARMTIARLVDGGLWVHSPIELTPELKGELDALGPVRHVLSPTKMHYVYLADFARAYPDALFYAPPHFEKQLPGVEFAGTLGDAPEAAWQDTLDQAAFKGSRLYDEVDFFHRSSRTLIVADLCFNIPWSRPRLTRTIARWLGVLGRPSASRTFFWTISDRQAVQSSLRRILEWDFDRIILSHGDIVESKGKAAFGRAFARLLRE